MIFFYQYISKGESSALSVTDMTTKNRECRVFEYLGMTRFQSILLCWLKPCHMNQSRLVAKLWRRFLCGLGKFARSPTDHSCWIHDNPHIYMENSVGFFCRPHRGPMLHDLCSSLQRGGILECPKASGLVAGLPMVHLGRPLDGVDSALPHTCPDMYKVKGQNHKWRQFLGGSIPLSVRHKHNSCLLFAPVGSSGHQRTQWI